MGNWRRGESDRGLRPLHVAAAQTLARRALALPFAQATARSLQALLTLSCLAARHLGVRGGHVRLEALTPCVRRLAPLALERLEAKVHS